MGKLFRNDKTLKLFRNQKSSVSCNSFIGHPVRTYLTSEPCSSFQDLFSPSLVTRKWSWEQEKMVVLDWIEERTKDHGSEWEVPIGISGQLKNHKYQDQVKPKQNTGEKKTSKNPSKYQVANWSKPHSEFSDPWETWASPVRALTLLRMFGVPIWRTSKSVGRKVV